MFKVVDGVVQVVENAFGSKNREDGLDIEDAVSRIPEGENQFDSKQHLPVDRAFPVGGFA